MAELVQRIGDLTSWPVEYHWFCPRNAPDDGTLCFDEDVVETVQQETQEQKAVRQAQMRKAEDRCHTVLEACKIFAFDGIDAEKLQNMLKARLKDELERCDICVRQYHRGRAYLLESLAAQHEAGEIDAFMRKFDGLNNKRISSGLDSMTATLLKLPAEQRTISAIQQAEQFSLLEALNSYSFLHDDELLEKHLDNPMRLVQTKKKIKMPNYTPGGTYFLFSRMAERRAWAMNQCMKMKRDMAPAEFDYAVKPFLAEAMSRVHIVTLDKDFLATFWKGARLIVLRLDANTITHSLRTMEQQLPNIALEHFQIDSEHLADMLGTLSLLLQKSPSDFWDSLANISPQTVVQQIFASPTLDKLMRITDEREPLCLEDKLALFEALIKSIKATNLVPPTRTILKQLMQRFQEDRYSRYAKTTSWDVALRVLVAALSSMRQTIRGGPVVQDLIEVVKEHFDTIMQELDAVKDSSAHRLTIQSSLDVIRLTLELDIQGLTLDREMILQKKTLDHKLSTSTLSIWKLAVRHVQSGHSLLAVAVVKGAHGLLAIDKFASRQVQAAPKWADDWNNAHTRLIRNVVDLLDRLQSFDPDELMVIFDSLESATGFWALLLNGSSEINEPALGVLKTLSLSDTRQEAIAHMVGSSLEFSLVALAADMRAICKAKLFTPCPILLKISADVYEALCDASEGILRSKSLTETDDVRALEGFWRQTWISIEMIFGETEAWSNLGYDKIVLETFCREAMDFASNVFEQYSIISSALSAARSDAPRAGGGDVYKTLMQHPTKVFASITKWLRLRDEYLITRSVSLTCNMLFRLRETDIQISQEAAEYVESIVSGQVKTRLSMNQKAELHRALEKHLGVEMDDTIEVASMPVKKQSSLSSWATSSSNTPVKVSSKPGKRETIDLESWSSAAQRKKELHAEEDAELQKLIGSSSSTASAFKAREAARKSKKAMGSATIKAPQQHTATVSEFKLKRQKEFEEKKKRDALAVAKAKGQTVGPGSGVQGLGDLGKDHARKGHNLLVSSDEESSEDEDDMDADLFGKSDAKKRIRKTDVDPNGAVGLKPEQKARPYTIGRKAHSAKDMRARLAPDLGPLHKVILKWDFFHNGDYPPGQDEWQFHRVANSFNDPTSYQDTFQPLLILEAWQGMVKSREENQSKPYEVKIVNRSTVDSFLELSSSVAHAENKELQLMAGDIILLSKARKPTEDAAAPHCLARIYRIKRQKQHLEVVYQVMPGSSLTSSLTNGASVYGIKIQSITPLEREYGALLGLQYYDLCMQIIKARPSPRINFSERQINAFMDTYNVNRAQSEAINAALENEGFSLIQGPPGSGKTKTIVAIAGGLLSSTLGATSGGIRINAPNGANGMTGSVGNDRTTKKLLVCAPSNAAVDELVMRLKTGVRSRSGRDHKINVVRIGRSDAINTNVQDVTMDELVRKRLGLTNDNGAANSTAKQQIFAEHKKISDALQQAFEGKNKGEVTGKELTKLDNDITMMKRKKALLSNQIDNVKDQEKNAGREAELSRKRAQQAVLDEAHVICATLSGSGHDMFQSLSIEFETVIIDEAAQCVEMSSLIPLKYGCVKCIMVGDPKQLPPTVFSKEAARFQYEQSLFVRMQNNFSHEIHLLDTQYRMHPEISVFPSRTFYDGLLKDSGDMVALRQRPWHASSLLAPYRFFDVQGQHQAAPRGHSLINLAEIDVALALYDRLVKDFSTYDFKGKIGIITPYKSQLRALKDRFSTRFGSAILEIVEFNTTDAFQGREAEVIIFSCVRASPAGGIGFLQDIRRMNVGLTRAKSSLWVLGNSQSLVRGEFWGKLVEDARARDKYTTGDLMGMLKRPCSAFPVAKGKVEHMRAAPPSSSALSAPSGVVEAPRRPPAHSDGFTTHANTSTFATPVNSKPSAAMEGVKYKLDDRLPKKRVTLSAVRSDRSYDNDVEMGDADDAPRSATVSPSDALKPQPQQVRSGSETPLSDKSAASGSGKLSTKSKSAAAEPGLPQPPLPRKRPAADPFMPKKKPRP